jgi:UDP-N-acetyl-D-galactosamine dehydrogenase
VIDLAAELKSLVAEVVIYDPHVDAEEAKHEYGVEILPALPEGPFDAIVLAVRHDEILELGATKIRSLLEPTRGFIYDLKEVLPPAKSDARL